MKKRLLKTVTVLCLLCGFFVPVRVHAESSTYYSVTECINFYVGGTYYYNIENVDGYESRCIYLRNGNIIHGYFVFSTDLNGNGYYRFNSSRGSFPETCSATNIGAEGYITNNNGKFGYRSFKYNYAYTYYLNPEVPIIDTTDLTPNNAVYYTFGEGAIDPLPPAPSYGNVANVAYSTRIAGSGTAAGNNIDRITWNTDVDSNGTVLPANAKIQIRAIPGQYTGVTKQDLLTKTYTDLVIDNTKAVQLVDILASRGVYETKWIEVISHFNIPFATFNSLIQGDSYWYRNGWIYQIRLQVDDYYSDWTNIYTATGSGVSEAETITNSDTITQELVQQIQIINNLNETTTNWYISETEINMQPYEEPAEGDKPWWAYLLEAIVKAFGNLLSFLGNLIGDLMDAITDLFKPAEFTINEYNDFKVEIKENSGLFGQAIDFTTDLKNTFMGVQYEEPILHWQGISFDGIVFLPAADYNLNEYVEMWGLGNFRQIAYICSDGFIFFSLLLLIVRKLNEVLKK